MRGTAEIFKHLPTALRSARLQAGFDSQEAASDAAGIGAAMLSRYEGGKAEPSLTTLGRLLEAYGLSVVELGYLLESEAGYKSKLENRLGELESNVDELTSLVKAALRSSGQS